MEYIKTEHSHVIKCRPEDIDCVVYEKGMSNKSIKEPFAVNGTFFSYESSGKYFSTSPLVVDGKAYRWGSNHGNPQSCFIVWKDNSISMQRVNNISEIDLNKVKHIFGGVGLINKLDTSFKYDPASEGFSGKFSDVLRRTNKTVLAYRKSDNAMMVFVIENKTHDEVIKILESHSTDVSIALDGGGSTFMNANGVRVGGDGRKVANSIVVKGNDETKPQEPSQDNMIKMQLIQKNYTKGGNKPKYIVIHNTDNTTADAQQHYKYWNTNDKANSSAHYVVDDKDIIKLVNHSDTAWHCGKKYGSSSHADCTNSNSIGIEICNHNGCDFDKAMENAIYLVKEIMKNTGISAENVITHKQACAKNCPSTILKLNKWDWFKEMLVSKPVEPPKEDDKFYRVCVGSYSDKTNADKMCSELVSKGYKPFIAVYEK